jgi:hypothetical protein
MAATTAVETATATTAVEAATTAAMVSAAATITTVSATNVAVSATTVAWTSAADISMSAAYIAMRFTSIAESAAAPIAISAPAVEAAPVAKPAPVESVTITVVIPGAGADEESAGKPVRSIVAIGCAGIRIIRVVAVVANRRPIAIVVSVAVTIAVIAIGHYGRGNNHWADANANHNPGMSEGRWNRQQANENERTQDPHFFASPPDPAYVPTEVTRLPGVLCTLRSLIP